MSLGSCNPEKRRCCSLLNVYPVGWKDEMKVDPLPAGKGKDHGELSL